MSTETRTEKLIETTAALEGAGGERSEPSALRARGRACCSGGCRAGCVIGSPIR